MAQSHPPVGHRLFVTLFLLTAIVFGAAVDTGAQASGGVVTGTIADAQGGVLPGATLTLRDMETGVVRTAVAESDGKYRLAGLPPGRYELRAELQGFASAEVTDLTINIGVELKRDVTLALQGVQESLTVTGQSPVVETTKSDVSAVVTQQQIDMLPVGNRQAVSLALLLPGTGGDNVRPRRNNANVGSGIASFYSTNFVVDGTSNVAAKHGEPRQDYPQTVIREFKVNVSQTPAEYGGRTGGTVIVVTKSGTNTFTGEAFEFFRNKSLNAMNKFEELANQTNGTPKPPYRRNQFGTAFGGPIVKDRLHFLVAAERTDPQQYTLIQTGKPQFYSAVEGYQLSTLKQSLGFARGDLQINPMQNLFVRWSYQKNDSLCDSCGGTVTNAQDITFPASSLVVGHTWVIGSRALNELRFQHATQGHFQRPVGAPVWDQQGVFTSDRLKYFTPIYKFPSLTWGPADNLVLMNYWEYRDDFSFNFTGKGSHTLKIGGAYQHLPYYDDVLGNPNGTWTFATDQFFDGSPASIANLKSPTQFTASFPPLTRNIKDDYWQSYVQDEWKPRSNLTLNLGLRYDVQTGIFNEGLSMSIYPRPLPYVNFASRGDKNNVAPRIGLAWDLNNDGRSVLRAGYGNVYHDILGSWSVGTEVTTLRQTSILVRNPPYPDPYQGKDPLTFASTAAANITIVDNGIQNPSAQTTNVGFSQELRANMALHIDGVSTRTRNWPVNTNINTPPTPTSARPDPTWGQIVQTQFVGNSWYKAMFVRLEKRYANRHQYMVSYTLADQSQDYGGSSTSFTGARTDIANPGFDSGPTNNDRRQSLVFSGAVMLPYDISLGAVWTLRSAMPFSAFAGRDLNVDGLVTDYVPGTSLNQGNRNLDLSLVNAYRAANSLKPIDASQIDNNAYNSVDMRASKSILLGGRRKIELIVQVFNLLGTDNLLASGGSGSQVTNALSDSFGRILQAYPRQQAEIAARVVF